MTFYKHGKLLVLSNLAWKAWKLTSSFECCLLNSTVCYQTRLYKISLKSKF